MGDPQKRIDPTGENPIVIVGGVIVVGAAVEAVVAYMKCRERCTGQTLGQRMRCDDPRETKNRIATCNSYCSRLATMATCIGLGDAVVCTIEEIEGQVGGASGD